MAENIVAPPCDGWGITYIACSNTDALDGLAPEERKSIEQMAVDLLWILTGRRLGPYPAVVRPCLNNCRDRASTWDGTTSVLPGFSIIPYACGTCCQPAGTCCCGDSSARLYLPGSVCAVHEVLIDGEILEPSAYRLEGRALIRTDGHGWPTCQDLIAPPTEPDTFQVTYAKGQPVPEGGQIAAGVLAAELAKALCGDSKCQLPARVQSITRQGVSMAIIDTFEGIEQGRTGIWIIDSWVASMNRRSRRARVRSVDVPLR